MIKNRRSILLSILIIALIFPLFSGLAHGKIITSYIIFCICLIAFIAFVSKKHLIKTGNLLIVIAFFLIFISIADIFINLSRIYQIRHKTIFQNTDIPRVRKYKPLNKSQHTRKDCYDEIPDSEIDTGWCKPFFFSVTTDSFGFRNKVSYPRKGFDIIILGDSFGFGSVDDEVTIPAFLINKYGLTTYNLSVSGTGPWAQYMTLKNELDRIKINSNTVIIWLLFSGNDLTEYCGPIQNIEELYSWTTKLQFARDDFYDFRNKSPIRALFSNFIYEYIKFRIPEIRIETFLNKRKMGFNPDYINLALRPYGNVVTHFNHNCLKGTFEYMNELVCQKNIDLWIVLLPSKEEVYEWVLYDSPPWTSTTGSSGFSKAIKELASSNNIEFFDTKSYLIEQSKEVYFKEKIPIYWFTDTHFNPKGNELTADYIALLLNIPNKK
ncbi:MAG: hypothetical protein ABII90_03890 [Bacteroidota bacterium]